MLSFEISRIVGLVVRNALQNAGIRLGDAVIISNNARTHVLAMLADHQADLAFSQEGLFKTTDTIPEIYFEAMSQATTYSDILVNQKANIENPMASVEKGFDLTVNDLDSNKTEEIFSQIDLAQVRISKDQEEIQSLAKETDDLLNQLEHQVS